MLEDTQRKIWTALSLDNMKHKHRHENAFHTFRGQNQKQHVLNNYLSVLVELKKEKKDPVADISACQLRSNNNNSNNNK